MNGIEIGQPSTVFGIDPGASGGIACWRHDEPILALPMPETEGDQIELILEYGLKSLRLGAAKQ